MQTNPDPMEKNAFRSIKKESQEGREERERAS
jgi:hypothetical protein